MSPSDPTQGLLVHPRPLSEGTTVIPLVELSTEVGDGSEPVLGIPAPLEVPLLVLEGERIDFDYTRDVIDFDRLGPLEALGRLATTQSGFLPECTPNFRFPAPLDAVPQLCIASAVEFAKQDKAGFRAWLSRQIEDLSARGVDLDVLGAHASRLSLPEREMLMIPLIYMNHMWRQGSPVIEPATGPSAMPEPLHALLVSLANETRILPRFNQIIMTMRAWRLEGKADGERADYRELTSLERMYPYFWLNQDNDSERDLYRAFFAVETFGIPLYGWGCLALECAAKDDVPSAIKALKMIRATLKNVYVFTKHMIPRVTAEEFRKIQVTAGWIEDELTGVASGYQLPFMLMLDALFHVNFGHPGVIDARQNNLRFVPELWKGFFQMVYDRHPALKTWVHTRDEPALTDAYQACVNLFTTFRSMHKHLGGQVIKGSTTTGRAFPTPTENYRQFIEEMTALVSDTAQAGDTSVPAIPDSPEAARSRGVKLE